MISIQKFVVIFATCLIAVSSYETRSDATVELLIVCDTEFGTMFDNDSDKIYTFFSYQMWDVNMRLKTLVKSSVRVRVVDIVLNQNVSELPLARWKTEGYYRDLWVRFSSWLYVNQVTPFNAAVLVIGEESMGSNAGTALPNSICSINHWDLFHSSVAAVGVYQTDILDGRFSALLTSSITEILGAAFDHLTPACNHTVYDTSDLGYSVRRFYLSPCTDDGISQRLHKHGSQCVFQNNGNGNDFLANCATVEPPSLDVVCQLLTGNSTLTASMAHDRCVTANCIFKGNNVERMISVSPVDNTPCGINSNCFRGRCLSKGYQFRHIDSNLCIRSNSCFVSKDHAVAEKCRQVPTPLETLRIDNHGNKGNRLMTSYSVPYSTDSVDKCLTVNQSSMTVQFKPCTEDPTEYWDFYELSNSTQKFLIFHHASASCLFLGAKRKLNAGVNCTLPLTTLEWSSYNQTLHTDFLNTMGMSAINFQRETDSNLYTLMYIATGMVLVTAFLTLWIVLHKKYNCVQRMVAYYTASLGETFATGAIELLDPYLNVASQTDVLPFDRKWEFPLEQLQLGRKIDHGEFGCVFEGVASGIIQPNAITKVAVKMAMPCFDNTNVRVLVSELKIMANLGSHVNLVNLLGACTESFDEIKKLYVILEYCENGSLRTYIVREKANFADMQSSIYGEKGDHYYNGNITSEFSTHHIISWAFQIERGMHFLAVRRILHGDLAARNILLTDNLVAKICDFGFSKCLTRSTNYNYKNKSKNKKLPYKWMAIESIISGIFSSESDCWSYGITLWEMFTLGDKPYPGISVDESFFLSLKNGYRMENPKYAPSRVYDMMLECWNEDPNQRPKFDELAEKFARMLGSSFKDYYLQLDDEFVQQMGNKQTGTSEYLLKMANSEIQTGEGFESCGAETGNGKYTAQKLLL